MKEVGNETPLEEIKYSKAVPLYAKVASSGREAPTLSLHRRYMGASGQRHAPAALYSQGKTPGTHCTEGSVGPTAGLDAEAREKILCLCWGSNPGCPARS
jgi:hypothetical protein